MRARPTLLLFAALGSVLVAFLWSVTRTLRPAEAIRSESTPGASELGELRPAPPAPESRRSTPAEGAVPRASPPAFVQPASAASPAEASWSIDGRVLDDAGRPIAGAEAWLSDGRKIADGGAEGLLSGSFAPPPGWETFRWTPLEVEVAAPGFAAALACLRLTDPTREQSLHLGTVRLVPGAAVEGRVRAEDGMPIPGARVGWGFGDELPSEEASPTRFWPLRAPEVRPEAQCDAAGAFRLRGVPMEEVFVHAWAPGFLPAVGPPFGLGPDGSDGRDLVLQRSEEPVVRVRGRVVDPEEVPVEGIEIEIGSDRGGGKALKSAADGSFGGELVFGAGATRVVLLARDPLRRWGPTELSVPLRADEVPIEIVLAAPRTLAVRLEDPGGAPIPWSHVRMHAESEDWSWTPGLVALGETGAGRVFLPKASFRLEALAPGFRTEVFGPFAPESVADPLVLVLQPGQAVRGRVVAAGRGVANARVGLVPTRDPSLLVRSLTPARNDRPFLVFGAEPGAPDDATTGSDGSFVLSLFHDGWHGLVVEADGFPRTVCGPWEWDRDEGAAGLELVLLPGGTLEGEVLVLPGRPRQGRLVGVCDGWGVALTTSTDLQGRYRFEDLAPGLYQVRPCEPPAARREVVLGNFVEARLAWDCGVRPGETTRFDLDLRDEEQVVLEGRVVLPPGEPPDRWEAKLGTTFSSRGGTTEVELARTPLDPTGAFRLAFAGAENTWITLTRGQLELRADLALVPGRNPWSLDVPWGRLRILPQAGERRSLTYQATPDGVAFRWTAAWDAESARRELASPVPAGPGSLRIQEGHVVRTLDVDVPEGSERVLELPAPAGR